MNPLLILEWTAAFLGAAYLFLVAKKNKWAWIIGGFSSFLYVFIFLESHLIAQAILSVSYVLLSIYAFWSWNRETEIQLVSWKGRRHVVVIACVFLSGILITFTRLNDLKSFTEKESFVLDVFLALFSLLATILGILKEKSNWIYWIFINLVYIFLYLQTELYPTMLLYSTYFFLGIYGLYQWNKKVKIS